MNDHDDLASDLHRLGRSTTTPAASATLATAVLDRVRPLPAPSPSRPARWRARLAELSATWQRRALVVGAALLVAVLVTPPVRAAVADWFGFAGVVVERGPDRGDEAPPPPAAQGHLSLERAAELVGFTPLLPAELGAPEAVEVSDDHVMVSMSWSTADGPVRLDQFDGRLDFTIAKTSPGVVYTSVGSADALWFERPHEVVVLDEAGNPRTESARLAGHTLIWPVDATTLRLEGDLTLQRALAIAASAEPYAG